jgi:hypothetical protein
MFLLMLTAAAPGSLRGLSTGMVASAALLSALLSLGTMADERPLYSRQKAAARQLVTALRLQTSPRPIYVANDFVSGHSTMSNVAKIAGASSRAEHGISLELYDCALAELPSIRSTVERSPAGDLSLTTVLPPCASFAFDGTSAAKLLQYLHGSHLSRNPAISYEFPHIEVGQDRRVEFGPVMTMTVRRSALLFYDFEKGDWVFVDSQ